MREEAHLDGGNPTGRRDSDESTFADLFLTQMDGDGNFDGLSAMGFSALHNFEEVSCDAATWTMVPPS